MIFVILLLEHRRFYMILKNNYKSVILFISLFLIISLFSYSQINKRNIKQEWNTDKTNHIVPLKEFIILLKRDSIKPIDNPTFINKDEALKLFFEKEPVIAIEIKGKAKAYPLGILNSHEIVNDEISGIKFTVNYCPLCYTSNVYKRELNFKGKKYLLDFGTSGMLRKSNLVMWDRQTESWWQQLTKKCLVGKLAGAKLKQLPSQLISVRQFFKAYPNGRILSPPNTTDKKRLGFNYYYKYDDLKVKKPRLFFDKVDQRFPAMERILGLEINNEIKAYPYSRLRKQKVIIDKLGNKEIVIFHIKGQVSVVDEKWIKKSKDIGTTTVFSRILDKKKLEFINIGKYFKDKQTDSKWDITGHCIKGRLKGKKLKKIPYSIEFSFAWFAFYPNSLVY